MRFFWLAIVWDLLLLPGLLQAQPVATIDLRNSNLTMQSASLEGKWTLYWHKLLTPSDLPAEGGVLVDFPQKWTTTKIDGAFLPAMGYATYACTVVLPQKSQGLGLNMPDVYSSYRLYINGALLLSNGAPGTSAATTKPYWLGRTLALPDGIDTMHLVLQIANFHHSKGGPYKHLVLGDYQTLKDESKRDSALDLVMSGALLMGGLFFFGLYLFGKYDRAMLFFSLYCITYSYRPVGSRLYVLHDMFPSLGWFTAVRLEYFTLFISVGFFALYTLYLYPKDLNKRLIGSLGASCLALAFSTLVLSPMWFTMALNPFLLLMFAVVAYTTWVYIRARRNNRIGSGYALASTVVIMLVMLLINLEYFQLLLPASIVLFVGYFTFLFLQSLVLAFRFANILDQARQQALIGLRVKSEFLSTMSHEIRTPLNAVIGMTHLLLKSNPRVDQQEQLGVLLFSAKNLLSIVNDILDYNKIEEGKISFESIPIDMGVICRNVCMGLQTQADEKEIYLETDIDASITQKVLGDPTRITQVISNLVHNAVKFTKSGGVSLRLKLLAQTEGEYQLRIEVEDSGIGIPQDKQLLIFERFTQADSSTSRSFGGTGLGLSIAKRILEMLQSKLELKSEVDKGSTFWFDLKMAVSPEKVEAPHERGALALELSDDSRNQLLLGSQILLVEDNSLNIKVATSFLLRWGAEVEVALNGEEALAKLNHHKHHLVLMDLHMPIMDGYMATRLLRERGETHYCPNRQLGQGGGRRCL
jgi:signal transduction histidine kinase